MPPDMPTASMRGRRSFPAAVIASEARQSMPLTWRQRASMSHVNPPANPLTRDLSDRTALNHTIATLRPDAIVNAAAYTTRSWTQHF